MPLFKGRKMSPNELVKVCGRGEWIPAFPSGRGEEVQSHSPPMRLQRQGCIGSHHRNSDFMETKGCLPSPRAESAIGSQSGIRLHDAKPPGRQLLTGNLTQKSEVKPLCTNTQRRTVCMEWHLLVLFLCVDDSKCLSRETPSTPMSPVPLCPFLPTVC